jgi:hypothetical protein
MTRLMTAKTNESHKAGYNRAKHAVWGDGNGATSALLGIHSATKEALVGRQ